MMMVKEEINYKEAYEKELESYEEEHDLTSQVMAISTQQIKMGRTLAKAARLIQRGDCIEGIEVMNYAHKGCAYIEEMKYDFVVAYCDELWRELRNGLWKIEYNREQGESLQGLDMALTEIRWQLVAVKDSLRRNENWDENGISECAKLRTMMGRFSEDIKKYDSTMIDRVMLEEYMALATYFMDAYYIGLQLKLRGHELKMMVG